MKWQDKLVLWKNDKIQPMTQPEVDVRYALSRFDLGRKIIKHLSLKVKGKKVLDASTGTGGIACAFAEGGAKVYGIDVNKYFLEISRQRFKDLKLKPQELKLWNGRRIPYSSEFFDLIICTDTLEHVPDHESFASEMSRVLKKGGSIFVTTEARYFPLFILWNPHDGLPFTILFPRFLRKFIDEKLLGKACVDYHWFTGFSEVKNLFEKHNIQLEKFDYIKIEGFNKLKKKYKLPEFLRGFYNLMMIQCLGVKK
ncbi:MAG: class I SAM-dependent methyltransferase [Candidatus Diapherotrites archaeon]